MTELLLVLLLYLALWPIELLLAFPFLALAASSISFAKRTIEKRSRFVWSCVVASVLLLPSFSFLANIDTGEMKPEARISSPDKAHELVLSFRSTTRSLRFIDPSCRVLITLVEKPTGRQTKSKKIDLREVSDSEQPEIDWQPTKVVVRMEDVTVEIAIEFGRY